MTHDPLCPQQPRDDGTTLTMLDGKPVYCTCALIAKVREDMLAKCIAALEERWSESWCGTRYASCTDPDHACRYRRLDMAALRALSANADSDGNVSERRQEKP